MTRVHRAPDGTTWSKVGGHVDEDTCQIRPAFQVPDTGQWMYGKEQDEQTVLKSVFATWTEVEPEPRRDPRITHLSALLEPVLADLPDGQADEIRAALDAVRAIPEEWSRRRVAATRRSSPSR
jgi:hypothetical protein